MWGTTVARMPRLKVAHSSQASRRPAAFPLCAIPGGLCDRLLTAIPMSIIGIQFIRDENDFVQDGLVIFSNEHADRVFNGGDKMTGLRFIATCQDMLLAGIWQRCLWVASSGKAETMIEGESNHDRGFLTISPYGDGLILCRSIELDMAMEGLVET
jgi:hypothetical protein